MMEHILLLEITIGLKELTISSARLGDKIVLHANQVSAFIDRLVHGDW